MIQRLDALALTPRFKQTGALFTDINLDCFVKFGGVDGLLLPVAKTSFVSRRGYFSMVNFTSIFFPCIYKKK